MKTASGGVVLLTILVVAVGGGQALWQLKTHQALRAELAEMRAASDALRQQLEVMRTENRRTQTAEAAPEPAGAAADNKNKGRQAELLGEEIVLAEKEFKAAKIQFEQGALPFGVLHQTQMQWLELKRALAALQSDRPEQKRLLDEEIGLVQKHLQQVKLLIQVGRAPLVDEFPVQRELLRLRRELAAVE